MLKTVTRSYVQERLGRPQVVLVEALPPQCWADAHIPGALNLPHDQVDELAHSLLPDRDVEVIVYCANGPCANSSIASRRLEQVGYTHVADYELGKEDWAEAGLPLESADPEATAR